MNIDTHNAQQSSQEQLCPKCGKPMPVYKGFITWCSHCNWNVLPYHRETPHNLYEALYQQLGKRLGKSQFERMRNVQQLTASLTPTKVAAFAVAALVHSFTLILFVLGLAIIILTWFNVILAAIGVLFVAAAWFLRPRIEGTIPDNLLSRGQATGLFGIADRISDALGTNPIDMIALDGEFNASFAKVGWQRKSLLIIGLPMFAILEPQERVALLAHEIAHGANGDPARSLLVGSALYSLNKWYDLLHPDSIWDPSGGIINIISSLIANSVMLGLSQIAKFWLFILAHLMFRDKQRAEYLADYMSAQAAGTEAELGLLRKLHMADSVEMSIRRFYLNDRHGDLFSALKSQSNSTPQRELLRLEQVSRLYDSRLDVTHPPTGYRIDMLNALSVFQPKVLLSEAEGAALDADIAKVAVLQQARILNEMTGRSYL